jgi:hypothetical protein
MAVDTPKLDRVKLLAAKIETTTGTAESLTASDATFIILNPVMTPDDPMNEREYPADLGQLASVPGGRSAKCTFDVELMGSGATGVPAWASTFLPACNWSEDTGTFGYTRSGTTLTIALYEDGLKRTMSGCRGTFKISLKSGEPAKVSFEFTGKYNAVSDTSILSPTFPTTIPPIFAGSTVSIGGSFTPVLSTFDIDIANEVVLREDATDASAYKGAAIVAMKPTGTLDPETKSAATRDWHDKLLNATEESLSIVIGSASNNTITIASTKMQAMKAGRGNRNKLLTDAVSVQFNGDSPLTIAFS